MDQARQLAEQGRGGTRPNPLVGAVLVQGKEVVGRGWHERAGGPHAEVVALREAGEAARGATLYVTLEPCSHYGRTPPCSQALMAAGVARVVVGARDPNPRVDGLTALRQAGIEVELLDCPDCARQNEEFFTWVKTGRAFVVMKYAMSLDGKIATRTGHSQWISGSDSRQWVHRQRSELAAVMVGSGTVLQDDPRLTARLEGASQPARVVVDRRGRSPLTSRLFEPGARRILATSDQSPASWRAALEERGVEVWLHHDLAQLLQHLGQEGLTGVLLEGGGTLNASAVAAGLVDKVACFVAPRLLGGEQAPTGLEGEGVEEVTRGWVLEDMTCQSLGTDLLVQGYLQRHWLAP
ncbi:bifunctional diaminohydroxyphosphoribosylaminopyrimidine deaminase/5-amino-6-(5-phosphoribosylamino)uracil reductase RibD [bacterium CPR1]|nr:bifunctional diaminohydroxyphosphoribosylaminopyrimidine deaminase/5-amino-6-(5-phosphoribosylamino)uracil reductase RibD [bacterium CPR1]